MIDIYEKIFRNKHSHGEIRTFEQDGFIYLSCSLCAGEIRIKMEE